MEYLNEGGEVTVPDWRWGNGGAQVAHRSSRLTELTFTVRVHYYILFPKNIECIPSVALKAEILIICVCSITGDGGHSSLVLYHHTCSYRNVFYPNVNAILHSTALFN